MSESNSKDPIILGIDEVGRGPLAGPLVIGAVILPKDANGRYPGWVDQLEDSKRLSFRRRESLCDVILKNAVACGLGWVKIEELNEIGLSEGLRLATRRAVEMVQKQHKEFNEIIIDGDTNFLSGTNLGPYTTTIIKGDDKIKEISAASIIAKVHRDRYMIELSDLFPNYGFERHMGYGTKQHLGAIKNYGACAEHRLFCQPVADALGIPRKTYNKPKKNTTKIGKKAENAVASFLESQNQEILFRNYKNKFSEIDIISTDFFNDKIYFTEVKYRKDDSHGSGLSNIDREKLRRMKRAAEIFLKNERKKYYTWSFFDPSLAVAEVTGDNFIVADWFPISEDGLSMDDGSTTLERLTR